MFRYTLVVRRPPSTPPRTGAYIPGVARCARFLVLLGLGVSTASSARAQLTSADLYLNVHAGVSATGVDSPLDTDSFDDGPRSGDIFLQSATIPWDLFVASGGAEAGSTGQLTYVATDTSQIYTRGDFSFDTYAQSPAAALGGFDAVLRIDFQVAVQTTFKLNGFVSALHDLDEPEVVYCQYNGVVLAGDTRATPLPAGNYLFVDVEKTLYPFETGSLECGAEASGGQIASNTLVWEATVSELPEPGVAFSALAAFGSLATLGRLRGAASSRARARRACRRP